MTRIRPLLFTLAALVGLTAAPYAVAQGLPAVNLGATSFLDGGAPAGPGLYFQEYVQFYNASRFNDNNGNRVPFPNPHLNVWSSLTQLIYLGKCDIPFLNAKPALDVLLPVADARLTLGAPGPFPRSNGFGLGDLVIGPALQFNPIMGEKGPIFVHRLEAQFIIPTGRYSTDREINPGSGFFSFEPYWAATVFLGPKVEVSWRAHYLWNSVNRQPDVLFGAQSTKAGEAYHMNFAASYELLEKKLRVGVNGYWLLQTTDAEIDGVKVLGQRERVIAFGPGAIWSFSERSHLFLNAYLESDARNRSEGTRVTVRYVAKF